MSNYQHLPPPLSITRQVATGLLGSPITLSREASIPSNPDETMRDRLGVYRTYLEHELEFLDNEIHALIERPPSQDPTQDHAFAVLRDGLKIRYNSLRVRLGKVRELLEVM